MHFKIALISGMFPIEEREVLVSKQLDRPTRHHLPHQRRALIRREIEPTAETAKYKILTSTPRRFFVGTKILNDSGSDSNISHMIDGVFLRNPV